MHEFDLVLKKKFDEMPNNGPLVKGKLFGESKDYNNCDDVWKFILTKCEIKCENMHELSSKLQILAMPHEMTKQPESRPRPRPAP